LGLNIRLKGYIYRKMYTPLHSGNGYTTNLLLDVFTQRNFVADFIPLNLNFIHKTTNSLFEPPFGGVRGNVVGKRMVNFLVAISEHFSLALTVQTL